MLNTTGRLLQHAAELVAPGVIEAVDGFARRPQVRFHTAVGRDARRARGNQMVLAQRVPRALVVVGLGARRIFRGNGDKELDIAVRDVHVQYPLESGVLHGVGGVLGAQEVGVVQARENVLVFRNIPAGRDSLAVRKEQRRHGAARLQVLHVGGCGHGAGFPLGDAGLFVYGIYHGEVLALVGIGKAGEEDHHHVADFPASLHSLGAAALPYLKVYLQRGLGGFGLPGLGLPGFGLQGLRQVVFGAARYQQDGCQCKEGAKKVSHQDRSR